MAIRAQFRGMPWPPAPNTALKEVEVTTTTGQPDWQKLVVPGALVLIGAGLLVASQYVFAPETPETSPSALPSGVTVGPYGLVIPTPSGIPRPPLVKPSPGARVLTSDKASAVPAAYGYGYTIPETTRTQIMAMAPKQGKTDPFLTALPKKVMPTAPPPPPPPSIAPLKVPAPPVRGSGPNTGLPTHMKPSIKKPTSTGPLVIAPEDISVQGVLTSEDSGESMVILNVRNELQTYRVGDMLVVNGRRLWVQAIDESRLVVTIRDATGRKVQLRADTS